MTRTGIWLATAVLWALVAAQAQAADSRPFRLCVLDQPAILQHSRVAQNMGAQFQQVRQQALAKLADDQRTLDADARALDKLRSAIPVAAAKARDAEIAQRRLQLKAREDQSNHDLAALDGQLTANVAKLSAPTVRAVEAERGCSMLIGSNAVLHLDDPSLDITPVVIDRMNAAAPPAPAR